MKLASFSVVKDLALFAVVLCELEVAASAAVRHLLLEFASVAFHDGDVRLVHFVI